MGESGYRIEAKRIEIFFGGPSRSCRECVQLFEEFVAVAAGLLDLARFGIQMSLTSDRRVLQMLRPAAQLS